MSYVREVAIHIMWWKHLILLGEAVLEFLLAVLSPASYSPMKGVGSSRVSIGTFYSEVFLLAALSPQISRKFLRRYSVISLFPLKHGRVDYVG